MSAQTTGQSLVRAGICVPHPNCGLGNIPGGHVSGSCSFPDATEERGVSWGSIGANDRLRPPMAPLIQAVVAV